MNGKIALLVACTLLTGCLPTESPQIENEDDPQIERKIDRLTLENYYRVKEGMTYDQVRCILGPATEEIASGSFGAGTEFVETLAWEGSWGANVIIMFQHGKVVGKSQFGLPHGDPTPNLPSAEEEKQQISTAIAERMQQMAVKKRQEEQAKIEQAKWHKWTSADGKFSVEAKFRGVIAGLVQLEKQDGTVVKVPKEKLSKTDQDWIDNQGWMYQRVNCP